MNKIETIVEEYADWQNGVAVEHESRLVRNVALVGQVSRNGHAYSEGALQAATGLYERKPVFLDHSSDARRPHERSTRDLVGSIVNSRYAEGRIRGDIRVLDTDSGRTFLALAESDTPGVGMSHVVLAHRSADGKEVERIEDVISVDAVVGPATTTTFRESTSSSQVTNSEPDNERAALLNCERDVVAEYPSGEITELQNQLERLRAERDELQSRLDRHETALRSESFRQEWRQAAAETGLPDYAITDEFLRQLETLEDDGSRRLLLRERVELLQRASVDQPRSALRAAVGEGQGRPTDDDFVAAVRGLRRSGTVLAR